MPRWLKWLVAFLCLGVIVAAIYLPILRRRIKLAAKLQQQTTEQARRELTQPVPVNPADSKVKAKMFWASGNGDGTLAATTVELPLSSDPVLRSKQVLNTLLAGPVDAELRTLPPDATLLAFYILPNGAAVADFSEALATAIPSGIQSEQLAVDSIARTLEANVPQVQRLRILIHGQELETLAGHLDLTGTFQVNTRGAAAPDMPASSSPATNPAAPTQPSAAAPGATPAGSSAPAAPNAAPAQANEPPNGTTNAAPGADRPPSPPATQKPSTPPTPQATPTEPSANRRERNIDRE